MTTKRETGWLDDARPLRVVYLDHCAKLSGGEIALVRLLEALGASVEPVVILAEDGPLVRRLNRLGMRVAVLRLPHRAARVTRLDLGGRTDPRAVAQAALYSARLIPVLRRIEPQIVHTNSLKSALYGVPAARLAGVPVVWHLRDRVSPDYMSGAAVRLVRAATRTLPTAVVANSRTTLETVPGARRGVVVPNAVPLPAHVPRRAASPGPLKIVMLGGLDIGRLRTFSWTPSPPPTRTAGPLRASSALPCSARRAMPRVYGPRRCA